MSEQPKLTSRAVRSFVIRSGRTTQGQLRAIESCWPAFGLDYRAEPFDWTAAFGRSAPLWLEIGFGNGVQTAHLAGLYPEINILGLEVHMPGVGHLMALAQKNELNNLRIMRHDAVEVLQNCVTDNSVERLLLMFPDPWPKKKHHKRRIVQADFVKLVADKLKPGGVFHLATDWLPYAEWMLEVISDNPALQNLSANGDFVEAPDYRLLTKFEQRGLKKGHEVRDLLFRKN
ncbi:MAG: tRNA (guanosine(46)-N7)-methyltransferase TrmB [Gammaproteobacteria bacterium]|nr:tRNA (guanosine(46)-N7)-methyltransferase TrmB [Gammaproteobacteria bacterium]